MQSSASFSAVKDFQVRWTVMGSVALHALIALLLLVKISAAPVVVPVGVEMLYLGEARSAAPPLALPKPTRPLVHKAADQIADEQANKYANNAETPLPAPNAQAAAGPAGATDGAIVSAIERYKFELRLFLESRKIYPETAKRLRQTGKVVVKFKVNALGDLSEVILEQGSPSEILNRAALELVQSAPRFKSIPSETNLNELNLSLPIEYIL